MVRPGVTGRRTVGRLGPCASPLVRRLIEAALTVAGPRRERRRACRRSAAIRVCSSVRQNTTRKWTGHEGAGGLAAGEPGWVGGKTRAGHPAAGRVLIDGRAPGVTKPVAVGAVLRTRRRSSLVRRDCETASGRLRAWRSEGPAVVAEPLVSEAAAQGPRTAGECRFPR